MKKIISSIIIVTKVLRGVIYFFIVVTIIGILFGGFGDGINIGNKVAIIVPVTIVVAVILASYLLPIYYKKKYTP